MLSFLKYIIKNLLPSKLYNYLKKIYKKFLILKIKNIGKQRINLSIGKKLHKGVNLFIHYNMKNSAGIEGRLLQQALELSGIPFQVIDLHDLRNNIKKFKKNLYNVNLIVCHVASLIPISLMSVIDTKKYYNIGYMAWELAELPDMFCENLNIFNEIWTLSSFCTNSIEKKSLVPVLTIPLYTDYVGTIKENGKEYFNIDENIFLFSFAYDCNSYVSRKYPQAAIKAFLKAFKPEDHHIGLLLKLSYPENFKEHINELLEILKPYPNIFLIDKFLTDDEMKILINSSDTFISLHRSEGLGLLPLEAMALGTPVISTAWSGNMEYMNHMNTALVGYKMVPVEGQYVGSTSGDGLVWAEPDIDEAASHMRRMVNDKLWREKLILNGKLTVSEYFNKTVMSNNIKNRLKFLKVI